MYWYCHIYLILMLCVSARFLHKESKDQLKNAENEEEESYKKLAKYKKSVKIVANTTPMFEQEEDADKRIIGGYNCTAQDHPYMVIINIYFSTHLFINYSAHIYLGVLRCQFMTYITSIYVVVAFSTIGG